MKRKRLALLALAILVGLIFSLHNLIPWLTAKSGGMVYTPFNNGDENIYAGQVKAAADGRLFSSGYSPVLPWVGPLLLGWVTQLTGSPATVFILADFFLPALIFYLLYLMIRQFKADHGLAVTGALASLFGYQLLTKINPIDWLQPMFFNFNRLIPPQLTYIFFLLFLLSLWRRSFWTGVWAGILAYVYFYHWSAALVILAWRRRFRELLLAGVISAPYLYQALLAPVELRLRFGRLEGRFFEPQTTILYLTVIVFIYFSGLNQKIKNFLIGIFAAAIILMNQQLVTGFTIAPGHWPSSTFGPLVPLVLTLVFGQYLIKYWKIIAGLILLYALVNQVRITRQWQNMYWLKPQEPGLFDFFKQQTDNPVVMTLDKRLNFFLPVMSGVQLYLPYGSYSAMSIDEIWQRFNCAMFLTHLTDKEIEAKLNDTQLIGHLFDLTYNQGLSVFSFGHRQLPEELKDWSRKEVARGPDCHFPVDYIIYPDGRVDEAGD